MQEDLDKPALSILINNFGSGGAEKVISLLLTKLHLDFNVVLILLYNDIHFDIPEEVEVIVLKNQHSIRPWHKRMLDMFYFARKYMRIIKKRKIKFAIAFLPIPSILNGIMSIFNPGVVTIISERGFPSDNTTSKLSQWVAKITYPLFYNQCDSLFSNSVHINRDLYENFGIRIPMKVIYNPIVLPEKKKDPESLSKPVSLFKVINVGTLNQRKNQKLILKAFTGLDNSYQLTLVGDGPLVDTLQEEIHEMGLSNQVIMAGRQKRISEFLLASDCFVLSSFTEGFPNVLLEAMAVGLPVISTNCLSGPLELLNENEDVSIEEGSFYLAKYGVLINNNDHIALQKALEYLKDHPKKLEAYSSLSLTRSKVYSLDKIYDEFREYVISNSSQ